MHKSSLKCYFKQNTFYTGIDPHQQENVSHVIENDAINLFHEIIQRLGFRPALKPAHHKDIQ
tara:strand:- start:7648 stop:7833 length:186 start_codon:yes stop_codon:yes gene_type:complete